MAIPRHALKLVAPFIKGEVLSLGYPDLEVSISDVEQLFGFTPTKFTDAHLWHKKEEPFPDSEEFFEKVGAKLTVVDFTADRGMEQIADLNNPQDLGQFDLVIDPGTLEHCFNIGQAFMNAASAVKVGGVILHLNPMSMLNHGFYNFNPTLLHDFYTQNGWQILDLAVVPIAQPKADLVLRFVMNHEYLIRTLVRKVSDGHLKYPIQTKYLRKIAAK